MAGVSIKINDAQMAEALRVLNPKQFDQAIFQAFSRSFTTARKMVSDETKGVVNLKAGAIKEAIGSKPPKRGEQNPSAVITITKKPTPAIDFSGKGATVKATKTRGVSVTMRRDRGPIQFPHYFKAKMKSGHVGIFGRTKTPSGRRARQGKKNKAGFVGRLTIREVVGTTVYELVGEALQNVVGRKLAVALPALLEKNMASQIDRFTKKAGGQ